MVLKDGAVLKTEGSGKKKLKEKRGKDLNQQGRGVGKDEGVKGLRLEQK